MLARGPRPPGHGSLVRAPVSSCWLPKPLIWGAARLAVCAHAVQTQLPWDKITGEQIEKCFFPGHSCPGGAYGVWEASQRSLPWPVPAPPLALRLTFSSGRFSWGKCRSFATPLAFLSLWLPASLLQPQLHAVLRSCLVRPSFASVCPGALGGLGSMRLPGANHCSNLTA